jgi:predicted adenine nucleotide alpha hydrolase (AANH) superfamily ATPase
VDTRSRNLFNDRLCRGRKEKKKKQREKKGRKRGERHCICADIRKERAKEQAVKLGHPVYHGRRTVNKSNCVNAREMDASNGRAALFSCLLYVACNFRALTI